MLTPFARYGFAQVTADGFTETGGAGALTVARNSRSIHYATGGLRLSGEMAGPGNTALQPRMSIAYSRGFDDLTGTRRLSFGTAATGFAITGARLGEDGLGLDAGLDLVSGPFRIGVATYASTAGEWGDHGVRVGAGFRF
jgi:uncharacterized protein with beta-barrel porin domain